MVFFLFLNPLLIDFTAMDNNVAVVITAVSVIDVAATDCHIATTAFFAACTVAVNFDCPTPVPEDVNVVVVDRCCWQRPELFA